MPLHFAEIGIPDVENQHRAVLFAAIPCFVLDRIIESDRFAFAPGASFAADTKFGRDVTVEPFVVFGLGVTVEDNAVIRSFSEIRS